MILAGNDLVKHFLKNKRSITFSGNENYYS
jgi:hypothetical protein